MAKKSFKRTIAATDKEGLMADPNTHNGSYIVFGTRAVSVEMYRGRVRIMDGPEVYGRKDDRRELYSGMVDWDRFLEASIRYGARRLAHSGWLSLSRIPGVMGALEAHAKQSIFL